MSVLSINVFNPNLWGECNCTSIKLTFNRSNKITVPELSSGFDIKICWKRCPRSSRTSRSTTTWSRIKVRQRCNRFETICPLFPAIRLIKSNDRFYSKVLQLFRIVQSTINWGNDQRVARTNGRNVAKHITKTVNKFIT